MRKRMFIFFVMGIILCTSCVKQESVEMPTGSQNEEKIKMEKTDRTLDAVAIKLGLEGGTETFYSVIGAIGGKEYNEGQVELYQFEEKSDAYKQIIGENSPIKISAYKEGFVILFPNGTKEDSDIVNAFKSIEFK